MAPRAAIRRCAAALVLAVAVAAATEVGREEEALAAEGKGALVTGAAGFIGSHVVRHCLDLKMRVIALDDLSGGFVSNLPSGATFIKGDFKDATTLERIFVEHKIHYVYHLGAYAAEGLSHFIRSFNYRTNLVGSVEILNQALKHGVECFVFTSSIAVYGSVNDLSQMQNPNRSLSTSGHRPKTAGEAGGFTEDDQPTPEDPYGIAKFAFELDLHAARELFGIDFVIFRPHNVYGPHQNIFDKYRNVVGIFVNQIAHGRPMTVFGDGEQVRAFSYIDDVAPVISRGPLRPGARNQVFNVGGDTPYTVNQLATAVKKALGKPGYPIDYQPARMEVEVAVSNHDKVKELFGTPEAVSLDEGLRRTVEWYQVQGRLFQPVEFASVEVRSRMPPSWVHPGLHESSICKGSRVDIEAAMDGASTETSDLQQREAYLSDEDVAFWVAAPAGVGLMPGALGTIRRFYPSAPVLVAVGPGGATAALEKLCRRYACTARELHARQGGPDAGGANATAHDSTCAGWLSSVLEFAPSAGFIVAYEPDSRLLGRILAPPGEEGAHRRGSGATDGLLERYATAGGTLLRRSSLSALLADAHALPEGRGAAEDAVPRGRGACLSALAGFARPSPPGPPDALRAAESCSDPGGALYPCYRCIHTCKLHEACYEGGSWPSGVAGPLRALMRNAYFTFAAPRCWVISEPCSCASAKGATRADACIQACSYTCPGVLLGVGATEGGGAFIDCKARGDQGGRAEL